MSSVASAELLPLQSFLLRHELPPAQDPGVVLPGNFSDSLLYSRALFEEEVPKDVEGSLSFSGNFFEAD